MIVARDEEVSLAVDCEFEELIVLRVDTDLDPFVNQNRFHVRDKLFNVRDPLFKGRAAFKLFSSCYLAQLIAGG